MAYTAYATYFIFFQNPTDYDFALAAVGGTPETGGHINISPAGAASMFGISYPSVGEVGSISAGIQFLYPYIPGLEIFHPGASGILLDDTVNSQVIPAQTVGTVVTPEMTLVWDGQIMFSGSNDTSENRRWITGFEGSAVGEGNFVLTETRLSRDSSRTIEGTGYPVRGKVGVSRLTRNTNQYTGVTPQGSWERFYIRLRKTGSATVQVWKAGSSGGGAAGIALNVTSSGQFQAINIDTGGTETVLGTIANPADLDRWYRVDVIFAFPTVPATSGTSIWMLNGFIITNPSIQFNIPGTHNQSFIGKISNAASTGFECDLDDWMNFDPAVFLFGLNSLGSHVRRHFAVSGTTVNWTPLDFMIENQMHSPGDQVNSQLSSSTAGAVITGVTDVLPPDVDFADASGIVTAARSAVVGALASFPIAQVGQIGYTEAGGAAVNANITGTAALANYNTLMQQSAAPDISPFGVQFTHHPAATAALVNGLGANVEYSGVWGAEDFANFVARPRLAINHNCNYWNTVYGNLGAPVDGPIFVETGTYVGNGLSQTFVLPHAAHFIFIRNTGAAVAPITWFATGLGGSQGGAQNAVPNYVIRAWCDLSDGLFKFSVAGSGNGINQSGVTYRYVVYCDPGARLNLCGAYNHDNDYTSYTNVLCDSGFTPEFGFLHLQTPGQGVSTIGLSAKGPGNAGNIGRFLDGTAAANWGSFATGQLITRVDSHATNNYQWAYSLFRTIDPLSTQVFVQITSYIGNGSNPRNIPLTPTSGKTPIFVIVIPEAATPAIWRDSSHAATNSSQFTTGTGVGTGIQALSTDQITVNSGLNANGTVYNVFALVSGSGSGAPPGTQWVNPPLVPPEVAIIGEGGLILGGVVPLTLLTDVSGIYTLVPGKTNDTLYDRATGIDSVDMKIPNPSAKTGYIGG